MSLGGVHVKHAVQRGIWVPSQHLLWDQGKPWSSWPVAGPSGCKLTSSQQSGIKYASPNTSPYLCLIHPIRSSKLLYDRWSVSMPGCRAPFGTRDQILLPVGMLLSEICGLVSVGCPLWREDGSAICSAITQWSESHRTHNHTLLSHLRLPQPGGPGSRIYIPQEHGGPVIPPGIGFPLCRLLQL
jgi:hypothetical protein